MNNDHGYLDFLWEDFINEKNSLVRAGEYLEKFEKHLLLHMELEDEYLFKRLNDHIGTVENSGLTSAAIEDHKTIIKLLGLTKEALKDGRKSRIVMTGKNLDQALAKHRERELELQYPVSEAFIEPQEWNEILSNIYGQEILKKIQKKIK